MAKAATAQDGLQELLTIVQVQRLLGYKNRKTIQRKIAAGEFGKVHYLSPRTPRIPRDAYLQYLANRTVVSEVA